MKKLNVIALLWAMTALVVVGIGCWLMMSRKQQPVAMPTTAFTEEIRLPSTPVKHQGNSSLCWVYAMLATIETEHLAQGDSVNLSPIFIARQFLTSQATESYLSQGRKPLSLRGMATMTLHLIEEYGAHPFDYYHAHQDVNWHVLTRRVAQLVDGAVARRTGIDAFREKLTTLLDQETGFMPRYVHMLGAEYSSEEFGQSVCLPEDYEALTSFSHHPWGERFALEVADNQLDDTFLNVPLDSMMTIIDHALLTGHPVCWEGDTSESGFSFATGVADTNDKATPEQRQRAFERFQTTDDHCMALVGIAHDSHGRRFYIAKNSWGTENPFGGYMYLSENYVRLKTICVVVPVKAIRAS